MGLSTFIPFPAVPNVPGVPLLARQANSALASVPALATALGTLSNILSSAVQQQPRWGIFTQQGNQVGVPPGSLSSLTASLVNAGLNQIGLGSVQPTISTYTFDFSKQTKVSTFPVEDGGFSTYNKVVLPAEPKLTLCFEGTENQRSYFINAIDAACIGTNQFNVVTPEITLVGYTCRDYRYRRSAQSGTTLIIMDVSLVEVREVSAAFQQVTTTPITNPVDPNAAPTVNSGNVQPVNPPPTSTLKSIANQYPSLGSLFQ